MVRVRRDVASLGGEWPEQLVWYAKAIRHLHSQPSSERQSWTYLGAIHGIDKPGWISEGIITASTPMPPQAEQDVLWNQCQHGTWFFLPWHRGYCWAFEDIVAAAVKQLGGPDDWALPYWNYLDATNPNARNIPPAFLAATMPDGSDNPLSQVVRNGTTRLGPQPWYRRDIDLGCMGEKYYTSAPGSLGFGGGVTTFNHNSGPTGAVESDPHNRVHVMVGGINPVPGWMSDPDYAALDPIFWLHHCNIDRLWAAWLTVSTNQQEAGTTWKDGPYPRQYQMPNSSGSLTVFTPGETLPGGIYEPTYDDLSRGTGIGVTPILMNEVFAKGLDVPAKMSSDAPPESTLLGSSANSIQAHTESATTSVAMSEGPALLTESLAKSTGPSRLFLNLEHVRGDSATGVLDVYIGLPNSEQRLVETLALFGLKKASAKDGDHAGNGLSYTVDITVPANQLIATEGASLDSLEVSISQPKEAQSSPISVERISIYRQPAS